jgi:YbbR domain-containing protein
LSQVTLIPHKNSDTQFFVITSRLRSSISSQVGGEFQLEAILPDTLMFEFTSLVEKKVKVIPNLSISFERQYMQSASVVVFPDSITISGPKLVIDTISKIITLPIREDRLNSDFEATGTLPPIKQVAFSHRKVDITVPVEKFTEALVSVPIEVKNKPSDTEVKLIPSTINFKCNVVLSQYSNLNSRYFTAQVDYSSIDWNTSNKLRVTITRMPDFINKFDFEPKYVEYIIERK